MFGIRSLWSFNSFDDSADLYFARIFTCDCLRTFMFASLSGEYYLSPEFKTAGSCGVAMDASADELKIT